MDLRPTYHPSAEDELYRAAAFYAAAAHGLGEEFLAEVDVVLDRLTHHPDSGSPYVDDTRRALIQRFPLSLVYRVEAGQIVIYAVMHHRQEPNYWRTRA